MNVWWWKEYPERDTEYVRWYPANIAPLASEEIINKDSGYKRDKMGVYLHVPFCDEICPFCPYNKFVANEDQIDEYVDYLVREINMYRPLVDVKSVPFVYWGGGSPSVLNGRQVTRIVQALREAFPIDDTTQFSMEVNPSTSNERIFEYAQAGINRISLGVQSFDNEVLQLLGSHHTAEDAFRIIQASRDAGIHNVGIDLLFNLPGQTPEMWKKELQTVIDLGLVHLSAYSMILDDNPNSALNKKIQDGRLPQQGDDEYSMELSRIAFEYLGQNGMVHYASCASSGHDFAVPGYESRYEVDHWGAPQVDYIGLGPGAYGYINNAIYCNHHTNFAYNQAVDAGVLPIVAGKVGNKNDLMSRFVVLGMKCRTVRKDDFREAFQEELMDVFGDSVRQLIEIGLIEETADAITWTEKGRLYVDNISKAFYNPDNYQIPQPLEGELQTLSRTGQWVRPLLEEFNMSK